MDSLGGRDRAPAADCLCDEHDDAAERDGRDAVRGLGEPYEGGERNPIAGTEQRGCPDDGQQSEVAVEDPPEHLTSDRAEHEEGDDQPTHTAPEHGDPGGGGSQSEQGAEARTGRCSGPRERDGSGPEVHRYAAEPDACEDTKEHEQRGSGDNMVALPGKDRSEAGLGAAGEQRHGATGDAGTDGEAECEQYVA